MSKSPGRVFRLITLLIWIAVVSAFWIYSRQSGLSAVDILREVIDFAHDSVWGPIIYIGFYIVQPIVFFPSTFLTIAAGYVYGPVVGAILAIIGSNGSSVLAWFVGRFFGEIMVPERFKDSMISRFSDRLRTNSFQSVLMMRLIYLPYDVVSYFSGFMRLSLPAFALATMLGGLPGTISFALFGSSITGDFLVETPSISGWNLAGAVLLFIVSISISRLIRQPEPVPHKSSEKKSVPPPNLPPESV
ncbi:MAG: TVP38/TMEM64 family protein [Anaerolineae bacterium]